LKRKSKETTDQKKQYHRVSGDAIWYFFLHNSISLFIFFGFILQLGLFDRQSDTITDLLSWSYAELVLTLFGISLLAGLLGRIFGYFILRLIFRKNPIKKIGEFNQGINKLGFSFLISTMISSVLFSIGATAVLQEAIFNEDTLFTLIATYVIIKICVFLITRMFTSFKL